MWQFIVSGYLPGTNIQIGFNFLMIVALLALNVTLARKLQKTHGQQISNKLRSIRRITI